ncbi:hypothetical protein PsYK624_034860 [Phanerochaete sordida]|uniref:Uncharacterized protein n=1 Tax=Phanerochaete sordida TaxID=48140 RepID=A0A9P3LAW9_9APHY|nr:hypothetical protein PsYK624_034860 [Phanerochaete sordida]
MCYPIVCHTAMYCASLLSSPKHSCTVHAKPWVETVLQGELRPHHPGWVQDVHALVNHIAASSMRAASSVVGLLPYAHGRVVLIDDSVHLPVSPHSSPSPRRGAGHQGRTNTRLALCVPSVHRAPCLCAFARVRRGTPRAPALRSLPLVRPRGSKLCPALT